MNSLRTEKILNHFNRTIKKIQNEYSYYHNGNDDYSCGWHLCFEDVVVFGWDPGDLKHKLEYVIVITNVESIGCCNDEPDMDVLRVVEHEGEEYLRLNNEYLGELDYLNDDTITNEQVENDFIGWHNLKINDSSKIYVYLNKDDEWKKHTPWSNKRKSVVKEEKELAEEQRKAERQLAIYESQKRQRQEWLQYQKDHPVFGYLKPFPFFGPIGG